MTEDLPSVTKRYSEVVKAFKLKPVRKPEEVSGRIATTDVSSVGGVLAAMPLPGRINPDSLQATRLTVLRDSKRIWHQGGRSQLHRLNSLQVLVGAVAAGDCNLNIDWKTTEALYEKGVP